MRTAQAACRATTAAAHGTAWVLRDRVRAHGQQSGVEPRGTPFLLKPHRRRLVHEQYELRSHAGGSAIIDVSLARNGRVSVHKLATLGMRNRRVAATLNRNNDAV